MSRAPLRDDLVLGAYAISLGFEIRGHQDVKLTHPGASMLFHPDGCPRDGLQFVIGDVSVWDTARGWRCARLIDGRYEKPSDSQFYSKLKDALDEGARNWRDR